MDRERLDRAYFKVRDALLAERLPEGYWLGELSSSPLATATAVGALALVDRRNGSTDHHALIESGVASLVADQNADGGWGDTDRSLSNISTTMLCRAAFHLTGKAGEHAGVLAKCEAWMAAKGYGRAPAELAESVRRRYGKDRTFAVPILTMCALAGLVDWREVPRLPFELACLPQSWYRFARLPVVSYALPALIAIGQVVHHHRAKWNPFTAIIRIFARRPSFQVLRRIQPSTGGYLEATPLTAFVTMSLAVLPEDVNARAVMDAGVDFIVRSMRPGGRWPIDSNLSVWVTTLSVNALASAGDLDSLSDKDRLIDWLLAQQMQVRHPFTGAAPGGWGWSHLSGSVPDCDDTPGALIAIRHLLNNEKNPFARLIGTARPLIRRKIPILEPEQLSLTESMKVQVWQILDGLIWVRNLQNRDRGWPTFCKGWGKLPFDRSGADLTAHAIRSQIIWKNAYASFYTAVSRLPLVKWRLGYGNRIVRLKSPKQFDKSIAAAFEYLKNQQRPDGSWLPLWFGNQHGTDDSNPVYGTARVLAAYRDFGNQSSEEAKRGMAFLLSQQEDGGEWGGMYGTYSSVEETALVVELLASWNNEPVIAGSPLARGIECLCDMVEIGVHTTPTPIGFYFAKLWYYEKLYPMIFATAALGAARNSMDRSKP